MKKTVIRVFILAFLALAVILIVYSLYNNDDQTADLEKAGLAHTDGRIQKAGGGSRYENDYFNLALQLPASFEVYSEDRIAQEITGSPKASYLEKMGCYYDLFAARETSAYYSFAIYRESEGLDRMSLAELEEAVQPRIDEAAGLYEDAGIQAEVSTGALILGDGQFLKADLISPEEDAVTCQRMIFFPSGKALGILSLIGQDPEELDQMEENLSPLN